MPGRLIAVPLLLVFATACGETLPTVPRDAEDPAAVDGEAGSPAPDPNSATADTTVLDPAVIDTVFETSVSGLATAERMILADGDEWASFWAELTGLMLPEPPLPEVDFTSQRIVVLAMGERPSGGYDIGVTKIFQAADTLGIVVVERSPDAGCVTTSQVTTPALVLRIPAPDGPVMFVEEQSVLTCG